MKKSVKRLTWLVVFALLTALLVLPSTTGVSAQGQICADITVYDAKVRIDTDPSVVILDVRTALEYNAVHIEGATLIPVAELAERIGELNASAPTVVHCKAGSRSSPAVYDILCPAGFAEVYDMVGGIDAWMAAGYPVQHKDLVVTYAAQNWIEQGSTYNVTFSVCNEGTVDAAASVAGIYIDGSLAHSESIDPLPADSCPLTRTVGPFTVSGESDTVRACADDTGIVTESDEGNNCRTAGASSGCFIATAAYGSYMDSHVDTLRSFRDGRMESNAVGSAFVSAYYRLSPPVAGFIDDHPALKPAVRAGLLPAVGLSATAVGLTLAQKLAMACSLVLASAVAALWLRRKLTPLNS